jgi:hypothetical protein
MKELLKLLTVALVVSTTFAEDVVKAEGAKDTDHKDAAHVEAKADSKHKDAAHTVHVNRKAANKLTDLLNKSQAPYAGPMTTIPVPSCCAEVAKPAAVVAPAHDVKRVAHTAKKAKHDDHKDAKPADAKKDEAKHDDHKDAKPADAKKDEAKHDDHKDAKPADDKKAVETAVEVAADKTATPAK